MRGESADETDEAQHMVAALVRGFPAECRETALTLVGQNIGLSKWSVWSLLYGRRKSVGHATMQALRRVYLNYLERQIAKLEAQLRDAEMRSGPDAFQDLAAAAESVLARLREARKRQRV